MIKDRYTTSRKATSRTRCHVICEVIGSKAELDTEWESGHVVRTAWSRQVGVAGAGGDGGGGGGGGKWGDFGGGGAPGGRGGASEHVTCISLYFHDCVDASYQCQDLDTSIPL